MDKHSPRYFNATVTNIGSSAGTFLLSTALPHELYGGFRQEELHIEPDLENAQQALLILQPIEEIAPGRYDFTVTAAAVTKPSISSTAPGSTKVSPLGVSAMLSPRSIVAGDLFQLSLINNGTLADTYDLYLLGDAAEYTASPLQTVSLDAGSSITLQLPVPHFVLPRQEVLDLVAVAVSQGDPLLYDYDEARLIIDTDTTPPVLLLDPHLPNPTNSSHIVYTGFAVDDAAGLGIDLVEYRVNEGTWLAVGEYPPLQDHVCFPPPAGSHFPPSQSDPLLPDFADDGVPGPKIDIFLGYPFGLSNVFYAGVAVDEDYGAGIEFLHYRLNEGPWLDVEYFEV